MKKNDLFFVVTKLSLLSTLECSQVTAHFEALFRYLFKIGVFFLKLYVWNENNVSALYKCLSKYLLSPEYLALTS